MKGKLLLGLALVSFISANTYAVEIYKGKIIKHKEWSTGTIKVTFKDTKLKLFDLKVSPLHKANDAIPYIQSHANAPVFRGTVGIATPINSEHMVIMQNATTSTQTLYYNFGVCLTTAPHVEECTYSYDEVMLEPGGHIYMPQIADASTTFSEPGSYRFNVSTNAGLVDPDGHMSVLGASLSESDVVITGNKR